MNHFPTTSPYTYLENESRRDDPLGLLHVGQSIRTGGPRGTVTIKFFDHCKIGRVCEGLDAVEDVYVYCDTVDEAYEDPDKAATPLPYSYILTAIHGRGAATVIYAALERYHREANAAAVERRRQKAEEKRQRDAALRELHAAANLPYTCLEGEENETHVKVSREHLGRLYSALATARVRFPEILGRQE